MTSTVAITNGAEAYDGYLALPDTPGPAVLVLHDWYGLLPHVRRACDELAAEGFVALAPDLYRGRSALTPAEAERLRDALESATALRVVRAAREWVATHPQVAPRRVGMVGFSLGAWFALRAATEGRFDVVVTYYAALEGADLAPIPCPVLGHYAERDEFDGPPEEVPARFFAFLAGGGTPAEHHVYAGTEHSFANADVPLYAEEAAKTAWTRTVGFLKAHLAARSSLECADTT
jgi:carboxymethylenebutenolidase